MNTGRLCCLKWMSREKCVPGCEDQGGGRSPRAWDDHRKVVPRRLNCRAGQPCRYWLVRVWVVCCPFWVTTRGMPWLVLVQLPNWS
jgi:hypothetical protein